MTKDIELAHRIAHVLAQLARLSEVSAAQVGRATPSSDQARLPAGVRPSIVSSNPERPPSKDRSLYDYFSWHFSRAVTDAQRRLFLYLAETDLEQRTHSAPAHMTALGAHKEQETGVKRDARIIAWYEGVNALEVAVLESAHAGYCSEANVRRVRELDRRNPATGVRWPGWRGWTDEERTKAARQLRSRLNKVTGKPMSNAEIAAELGTTKSTVSRYLQGYTRKAA